MALEWFGTINPWDSTGNTGSNWPDSNNIPVAKGQASGHQFPWNMMRNDSCNPVHQHYVNAPAYTPGFQKASDYCKANGMSLMFQAWYPAYDGATAWSLMKTCFQGIVQYVTGYPVYIIIANELLTGANPPVDCGKSPFAELGGKGSTGIDGFINWIKELRKIFPANCKLGLNEFNACDQSTSPGAWNLQPAINCYNLCKQNGAPLDYLGVEGYWLNNNFGGYSDPLSMIDDLCNKFGGQTGGTPVIYSECTLDAPNKGPRHWAKQVDVWKAILPKLAQNQYVIGFTGPWGGYRYQTIWNGSSGENCRGLNWMYNDSGGNASQDPDGGSNVGPGAITQALTWLQGWVPQNVTGSGGNPNPSPQPESPDGTVVANDSGNQIVDSHSSVWTCVGGVAKKDGSNAAYTANVAKLAYYSHVVWQCNAANQWWKWTGSDWTSGADPTPKPPPTLTSGTYLVPTGTQIIVP
jgi:hypothetical protein